MKHPTPESWMAYLYDDHPDLTDGTRAEAEAHLAACPECRQQVLEWRSTLALLDQDGAPQSVRRTATVPVWPARPMIATNSRPWGNPWPWALAAGLMLAAAFVAGRGLGPTRSELELELAKARREWTREIAAELRASNQRDLTELATLALKASAAGQQDLADTLVASFNEARQKDRLDWLTAMERMERHRSEEMGQLREGFRSFAEKAGGAFQETDTRLNALTSVLPVNNHREPH